MSILENRYSVPPSFPRACNSKLSILKASSFFYRRSCIIDNQETCLVKRHARYWADVYCPLNKAVVYLARSWVSQCVISMTVIIIPTASFSILATRSRSHFSTTSFAASFSSRMSASVITMSWIYSSCARYYMLWQALMITTVMVDNYLSSSSELCWLQHA